MTALFNSNISQAEALRRYTLAIAIIGIFFANPALPAWITLLALYPFVTALTQWDPLNVVFSALLTKYTSVFATNHPVHRTH